MLTLDRELIFDCQTDRGGWTYETLKWLGIPPEEVQKKGWIDRAAGKQISFDDYGRALRGRTITAKMARRMDQRQMALF